MGAVAGEISPRLPLPPFVTGLSSWTRCSRPEGRRPRCARSSGAAAIVLSSASIGVITRMMRGSMLDVLGEDYVRTARSKGLPARRVTLRRVARNTLLPVITVIALSFGGLLSGAVVTETVFAWPGLGWYAFQSASSLDFPAIMGVGIVVAVVYVLVNLLSDVAYAAVDPRVRMG